ncbi:hypothetical protein [Curvivirga sp.]|uniref:hypothetical protein n=1 Tax=Curvivirga sp. TaxID=2856848 RepID=UPI003B5D03AD
MMLLAGCTTTYTDTFVPIADEQAVLGWKDEDFRFAKKGTRTARADARLYEEIYNFDDNKERLQLYVGMYENPYSWDRNRGESNLKETLSRLPIISNAKEVSYFAFSRTSKTVKLYLVIDGQECAAFTELLQLFNYRLHAQYRSYILGIYCTTKEKSIADNEIDKVRNAYSFKDDLYDGTGL